MTNTLTEQQNARFAIDGAIEYGKQGINKPPSADHWLMEYWEIGRKLAQTADKDAEPVQLGELLFSFYSYTTWINKAQGWFANCGAPSREIICVDSTGRICAWGEHFMDADKRNAYPVNVYRIRAAIAQQSTDGKDA